MIKDKVIDQDNQRKCIVHADLNLFQEMSKKPEMSRLWLYPK